jgi:KDO2-lipid IV(A) lauroyltransferase
MGKLVGCISFYLNTRAAKVSRANLELCLPSQAHLVKPSLVETGKTMMETPAVWLATTERIDAWIETVHNEAILQSALNEKQGLLLLLPHVGNWELFNVFFRRYGKFTALYQPPRQKGLQPLMAEIRDRHGNETVPTTRTGIARLYRALGEGGNVVILPDQVPASGRFATFFGQQALTDPLSSRLLQKTGAKALGVCVIRQPNGRFAVHVIEPPKTIYEPASSLAAVNELVEHCVLLAPTQYQWEYKRFRERPAGEDKIYRFKKPPGVHH